MTAGAGCIETLELGHQWNRLAEFYSEDLPGFDDFEGLKIVNPFK